MRQVFGLRPRFSPRLPTLPARVTLGAVLLVALALPASALAAQDAVEPPQSLHPTEPGAPFYPSASRTGVVIERAELLIALDDIALAEESVGNNSGLERTAQIIASQRAQYERELAQLEPQLDELAEETEPYGIEVGVFPVDELRKMFWDDWGQPRSGGRRHLGTDMLAQIGVPLRAIEDSTVERESNGGLGGLSIYLRGDSGARYFYTHLDSNIEFEAGERVYAGQIVGINGDSGNARGVPHLHLQIAPDGESGWENPFPLLDVLWSTSETQAESVPPEGSDQS